MPKDAKSTTEQKVPIRLNPKTPGGKPAKLDGPAKITIIAGGATSALATQEELDKDAAAGKTGLQGYIISEDVPGTSSYEVEADTDLGEGVRTIVDGGTYVYNDPEAESLGLDVDEPVLKLSI